MAAWLRSGDGRITLTLHIQPGAKRSDIAGEHGDALRIRLAAPPVDGKANAALVDFLAARLGVPKAAITLLHGQASRRKVLEVRGALSDPLRRLLGDPGAGSDGSAT
jgi:uncharacterized protein (TIGR00251 family)